jgi:excisionase family DNA binding protein
MVNKNTIEASLINLIKNELEKNKNIVSHEKSIFNIEETAFFTGFSKSHIYKLTSTGGIPCYKRGKHLFFKREELEQWLLSNRRATKEEIDALATNYVALSKKQGTSISASPKLQLKISSQLPV